MVKPKDYQDLPRLVPLSAMGPPAVWLASEDLDGVNGMRLLAKDWDASLPPAQAYQRASSKAVW